MILNSIEGLKKYLGRAINAATTLAFIEPFIQLAQDEYIQPAIGPEMLAELDAQFNASPASLTPVNRTLLALLQRALAFYTYSKYLPYSLGTDGDNGLQEQGTQNTQPVRMGVLDKRQRESAENAATALENALQFLALNQNAYPTWKASATYQSSQALFVSSATRLTQFVPQVQGSYRLFTSLKPYLQKAERNDILPMLGEVQFAALKMAMCLDELETPDKKLLEYVAQATATCAYAKALYHLNVVQTPSGGLRVLSDFDGIYNQKAVEPKVLDQAQRLATNEAATSLNSLKAYLTKNADAYPLYKNSDRYTAPGPNELPDNSDYKGIFRMR